MAVSKTVKRMRIAAYVICIRDDEILLSRLAGSQRWTLPGGGLDHGEDPFDGVLRELAEETGYSGVIDRLVGIDSATWAYRNEAGVVTDIHGLRVVYEGRVVSGELRPESDGSTDRASWIRLDEIDSLNRVDLIDRGLALQRRLPKTGHLDSAEFLDDPVARRR